MTRSLKDTEVPPRGAYRLRLSADEVRELGRYLSAITARVRAAGRPVEELTVDLGDAPTVPVAQLVLLVRLLRQTLGDGVPIAVSRVRPSIVTSLVAFGIPRDVVVIDSRGRRWTG